MIPASSCSCDRERAVDSHGACFNVDRTHRFAWWRRWSEFPMLCVVMLNPSTADENAADPTITRVVGFAKAWGYGGVEVVNAFSLRSTNPEALMQAYDEYALDPFAALRDARTNAHLANALELCGGGVVIGWGAHLDKKPLAYRLRELRRIGEASGKKPWAFALTKHGGPKHPLYVPAHAEPVRLPEWPTS